MNTRLEWQFGGWLQSLPPAAAWSLMALLAVSGLALIVFLYRNTLRKLSPWPRWTLTALRVVILLAILVCLANPVRVDRAPREDDARRTLAVVVDRSASMNAIDNRTETRLGNALRIWREHVDEARNCFQRMQHYRFSTSLEKAPDLDAAAQASDAGAETHLFAALNQVLDDGPAAVVCLTDGLDTTSENVEGLVSHAQRLGVPLYFVAGRNRSRTGDYLNVREVKMPSQVLRQSQFTASAAMEIASPRDCEVPVELWSREQKLASTSLKARAGWNMLPWTALVTAGEPGPMPLEFRLGEGAVQQVAGCTTQVVEKTTVDVLYYQGALQWGCRFLLSALQSDPSFKMTSILNPALGMQMTAPAPIDPPMNDLPEDAAALKRFRIVILSHVFADQLSGKQQQALVDYAKNGGGVLFVAPGTAASAQFAGTQIEQMLPVVFEPPPPESGEDAEARRFQNHMQAIGGSNSSDETGFAAETMARQQIAELTPFAAPTGATASSKVFLPGPDAPQFSEYTRVRSVKPGAEILAVHPTERADDGAPRVLVARQRFGSGFTAAMTTDLLWRWKLSVPSTSRVVETFWQQFMLSLAPAASGQGLRLLKEDATTAVDHPILIRIEGAAGGAADIVMVSPAGVRKPMVPRRAGEGDDAALQASFIPDVEGRWEVQASDKTGGQARITLPVTRQVRTKETMNLPVDEEALRRIADATGGALIESDAAAFHQPPPVDESLRAVHAHPLWNTQWLIALLLGIYSVELISRRFSRLL